MLNKDINDMNDTYAMLPPEEEGVPLQVGYALPRRARRRKACASVLCLMLGMTVVLTFFLIPRDPDIRYVEGKSSFNNETKVNPRSGKGRQQTFKGEQQLTKLYKYIYIYLYVYPSRMYANARYTAI